jgi:hypothetical protein
MATLPVYESDPPDELVVAGTPIRVDLNQRIAELDRA